MEVTIKVEAESYVTVRMDQDGTVIGKVVGRMAYADVKETVAGGHVPMVTAEVEFDEDEIAEVKTVLVAIAKKRAETLANRLNDARADARRVGRAMGELI